MARVGQKHMYTVCIRYFWQENHHIYGHIWCIYTALANPKHVICMFLCRPIEVCVKINAKKTIFYSD